jgi:putative aldouronate transport system substrate-binding protein
MKQLRGIAIVMAMLLVAGSLGFAAGAQEEQMGRAEAELPPGFNETGLPLVDETATLKVLVRPHPAQTKPTENFEAIQWIHEMTNVEVEWDELRGEDITQRVNLMFAGGDLPDVCLRSTLSGSMKLNFAEEGLLLELSDLIEEYAPNIQHMFDVVPTTRAASLELDGSIYGIAGARAWQPDFWAPPRVWGINSAWLDTLSLAVPETTDDLYAVLQAFKTQDPNGNGEADEVPIITMLSEGMDGLYGYYLFAPFGVGFQRGGFMVDDDTVVSSYTSQNMREALVNLRRLYAEGLINEDLFTIQGNELMSRARQQDPVIVGATGWWTLTGLFGARFTEDEEFGYLDVVQSRSGNAVMPIRVDANIQSNQAFITSDAEYPALAMRWIDTLFDELVNLKIAQGPIEWIDDATATLAPVPEDVSGTEFRVNTTTPKNSLPEACIYDEYTLAPGPIYDITERRLYTERHADILSEQNLPTNTSYLTEQEASEIARLWTPLKEYLDRMCAEFVVEGGIDEKWEEYVATADRMGLGDVVAIYQREYDRFKEAMGGDTSLPD